MYSIIAFFYTYIFAFFYTYIFINIFNTAMPEQEWECVPPQAFLYFPAGEEVKSGFQEKQWRKIFEGGVEYEPFEQAALAKLQQKLKDKNAKIHEWFDRPNLLRFLQANKFKNSNTIDSMLQTTKWRNTEFPIKIDAAMEKMLNSGAFYFSGRDDKYRPIIVADIGKFDADDVDTIPRVLAVVMEFMIGNLLIEGQVQNYILVMNLQEANFGLRNVIMKILSFTSNAYRGRLFASYILAMPTIIRWGWQGIISKFVSENTLKKIKITGQKVHEDMWTHISKDAIEQQYGGNMQNVKPPFWPPNQQLLRFVNGQKQAQNKLITPEKYLSLYNEGKLKGRKVLKSYVWKEPLQLQTQMPKLGSQMLPIDTPRKDGADSGQAQQQYLPKGQLVSKASFVKIDLEQTKTQIVIQTETSFIKDYLTIKTFFQTSKFQNICAVRGQ